MCGVARQYWPYVARFHVELFAFLFAFSTAVEDVTIQLAAQDKFCMHRLNDSHLCAMLPSVSSSVGDENDDDVNDDHQRLSLVKDQVLVLVTTFNFYQTLIYTVPLLFTSLLLSSWADRHRKSAKILLCLASAMYTIESATILLNIINFHWDVYWMLVSFMFFPLVGGTQVVAMTVLSYVTTTSAPEKRIKRFVLLEVIAITAGPLGIFIGGQLIRSDMPLSQFARHHGMLHNYHYVLILSVAIKMATFVYVLFTKFRKRPKTKKIASPKEKDPLLALPVATKRPKTRVHRVRRYARNLSDIFVLRNIAESFETCRQRRENQLHIYIWLLLATLTLVSMTQQSLQSLLFQFVQKVYLWDAATFSTYHSVLFTVTRMFGLLVITPALTEALRLNDSTILIIGLLSVMGQNFVRGTIIHQIAFCLSYVLGSVTKLVWVAIRATLSKMVPPAEQYRLFGMLAMMETISPMIGIAIYTQIFNTTIGTYPGFVYQFSCFLVLLAIIIAVYVGIKHQPDDPVDGGGYQPLDDADNGNQPSQISHDVNDTDDNHNQPPPSTKASHFII